MNENEWVKQACVCVPSDVFTDKNLLWDEMYKLFVCRSINVLDFHRTDNVASSL